MKQFAVLVAVLCCAATFGQKKYYKGSLGNSLLDEAAYSEAWSKYQKGYLKNFPKAKFKDNLVEVYRAKDSIIMSYAWAIDVGTLGKEATEKLDAGLPPQFGKKVPIEKYKSLDGKTILISGLKGRPTLVNFWFTTCAPCIAEMPVLNDIKKQFGDKINFIAVTYEPKAKVMKFLKKHKFDFVHVTDAQELIDSMEIKSFPTNMMLDKDAEVTTVSGGIPMEVKDGGEMKISDGKGMRLALQMILDDVQE